MLRYWLHVLPLQQVSSLERATLEHGEVKFQDGRATQLS